MALPSPVADFPDLSGTIAASHARARGLMDSAWADMGTIGHRPQVPGAYGAQAAQGVPQETPLAASLEAFGGIPGGGARGGAGGDPTFDLLREFEGFSDKPYWDVTAHRGGYGSDTVTFANGEVVAIKPDMIINREDAERDLQRRVNQEFQPRAISAVGQDVWGTLNPDQRAALNSITYNYGSLPGSVAEAVRSGDLAASVQAIGALSSHNNGVNARRRAREAAIFGSANSRKAGS